MKYIVVLSDGPPLRAEATRVRVYFVPIFDKLSSYFGNDIVISVLEERGTLSHLGVFDPSSDCLTISDDKGAREGFALTPISQDLTAIVDAHVRAYHFPLSEMYRWADTSEFMLASNMPRSH